MNYLKKKKSNSIKLEFVDFVEGDIESERKANNHFYEINKDKLMELYRDKWIIIMEGGRKIETFEDYKSLFLNLKKYDCHKLCWKMVEEKDYEPWMQIFKLKK